mmetsp:Transcript_1364/g.4588  ORF Transcript_1364/g.4588 Transcript_1364/m.4588 type:complete len:207 (-) Transcript_1364:595-1215(-)
MTRDFCPSRPSASAMNTISWSSKFASTAAPDSTSAAKSSPHSEAHSIKSFSLSLASALRGGENTFAAQSVTVSSTLRAVKTTLPPSPVPGSTKVFTSTGTPALAMASAAMAMVGELFSNTRKALCAAARDSVCWRFPSLVPLMIQHPNFAGSELPPRPARFRSITNGGYIGGAALLPLSPEETCLRGTTVKTTSPPPFGKYPRLFT